MKKRCIVILFCILLCLWQLSVLAAEKGSIEIRLPQDMRNKNITVIQEGGEAKRVTADENGVAKLENLTEGIYRIEVPDTENYVFVQAEVSIPHWSEEEHRMLYEITVIPKYSIKEKTVQGKGIASPLTADLNHNITYIGVGIISLIILCIMSCHNRFKCDTMTGKYSKNGGQNNGNDNDTENPRSTRRIRLSSPGSID